MRAGHAYSDATTPGFFHDKCQYHRLLAAEAALAEAKEQWDITDQHLAIERERTRVLQQQVTQQAETIDQLRDKNTSIKSTRPSGMSKKCEEIDTLTKKCQAATISQLRELTLAQPDFPSQCVHNEEPWYCASCMYSYQEELRYWHDKREAVLTSIPEEEAMSAPKPEEGEIWDDKLARVRLMADGDDSWDLSENDKAALDAVLKDREHMETSWAEATRQVHELRDELDQVKSMLLANKRQWWEQIATIATLTQERDQLREQLAIAELGNMFVKVLEELEKEP